jgi:hypothetical protein
VASLLAAAPFVHRLHLLRLLAPSAPDLALEHALAEPLPELVEDLAVAVLAAIATVDPQRALALHGDVDWQGAAERDALHAIARCAAPTAWETAIAIVASIEYEGARGLALHDLAGVAAARSSPAARRAQLLAVLRMGDDLEDYGRDCMLRGVIGALRQIEPDPRVLVPAILVAAGVPELQRHLGKLAWLAAHARDPDLLLAQADATDRLLRAFA